MSSEWKDKIEDRVRALEDQSALETLALAVAKSEAERIIAICKAYAFRGPRDLRYMTKIETAALRIIHEIDSTNVRPKSVSEVSPSMGLREQDSEELRTDDSD